MGVWGLEELQQEVEHCRPFYLVHNGLTALQHIVPVASTRLIESGGN